MSLSTTLSPPLPQEDRSAILKILSTGIPLAPDVDLEELAARTHGFTGADLKALLYNAQLEAINGSQETTCDMSLSAMSFPNTSSGSDDLADDVTGDGGVSPEPVDLQVSDNRQHQETGGDVWRLYFDSSSEPQSAEGNVCLRYFSIMPLGRKNSAPMIGNMEFGRRVNHK